MILCNRNDPLSHSVFASQGYGLFPCAHLCCVSDRALLHFLFLKPGDTMHLLQSPQGTATGRASGTPNIFHLQCGHSYPFLSALPKLCVIESEEAA